MFEPSLCRPALPAPAEDDEVDDAGAGLAEPGHAGDPRGRPLAGLAGG